MLRNARVTAFTVSELLRENQQGGEGGGGKITPHRLGLTEKKDLVKRKYGNNENTLKRYTEAAIYRCSLHSLQ